jgi:predicted metal-dependent hydrolase
MNQLLISRATRSIYFQVRTDCRAKAGRCWKNATRAPTISRPIKRLWQYTQDLKSRYLKSAPPINKVMYDNKIHVLKNALGLHTAISRAGRQAESESRDPRGDRVSVTRRKPFCG